MPNPPRRARFQIHLSTAIVLMFVAGGLIWANVNARRVKSIGMTSVDDAGMFGVRDDVNEADFSYSNDGKYWHGYRRTAFGWPTVAVTSSKYVRIGWGGETEYRGDMFPLSYPENRLIWDNLHIFANALVALIVLAAVWIISEWLIRRRAARKGV